jgi:lipoprotein-anchoring transpeptidase ErfK/SrfK
MQRLFNSIGAIAAIGVSWLAPSQVALATLPPVQPDGAVFSNPVFPANVVPLPIPIQEPEIDLPPANSESKPLYQEPFQKPNQEKPLRLEIKLSRRQVTLYRGSSVLKRYKIAVGRAGWETPKGTFQVKQMFRNPAWIHPLKKGISIPGGDPENPLGRYWIGFWSDGKNWIGFHGTDNPDSVGKAVSHGCIRMYNSDIEELFKKVSLGTEVKVVQ